MSSPPERTPAHEHDRARERAKAGMLDLVDRVINDPRVLAAMAAVPRERFVSPADAALAYDDRALAIGEGQTISQPVMVALMLDALSLRGDERVLEVGAGSGYVAAILSRLAREVVAVELVPALADRAREVLSTLGCERVTVHNATSGLGWPPGAPFDAIVVSAAAPHVPRALIDQLADGGRMAVPVGSLRAQHLILVEKTPHGVELRRLGPCAFVPLLGEEAWRQEDLRGVSSSPIVR